MCTKSELKAVMLNWNLEYILSVVKENEWKVDLSKAEVTDSEAIRMANSFSQDCGVGTLDLSHNAIGDKGAFAIASFIYSHMGLNHLNLSHNNITDIGAKKLLDAILYPRYATNNLETFDISNNKISPEMEAKLMAAFEETKAKQVAYLNQNN